MQQKKQIFKGFVESSKKAGVLTRTQKYITFIMCVSSTKS